MRRSRLQFILIVLGVALGFLIATAWNAILLHTMWRLHLNDLGKFYYDAQAFVSGQTMYGPSPATEIPLSETVSKPFLNLNPPHMHLLLLPLAFLESGPVLIIWLCSGLACMGSTFRWALRETGHVLSKDFLICAGLAVSASAAFGSILVTGQITMHLLPLVAWAWTAARHQRWMQVGVALGLGFSIKPFLLIFLPWLAIRGRLSAAGLSVLVGGPVLRSRHRCIRF